MAEPETEATDISLRAAEVAWPTSPRRTAQEQRRLARSRLHQGREFERPDTPGRGTRAVRRRAGFGSGWLVGQVVAMAPRLRVRDQAALPVHFPRPVRRGNCPARSSSTPAHAAAAAGGAVGMAAVLPVLPAFPAEVAAETLVVVGIEVKLVAELHEAYGIPAPGNFAERMSAYLAAWAHRRGVFVVEGGLILAAGSPLTQLLRGRLMAGPAGARSPSARCSPAPPRAPCSTAGRPGSLAGTSSVTCAAVRSAPGEAGREGSGRFEGSGLQGRTRGLGGRGPGVSVHDRSPLSGWKAFSPALAAAPPGQAGAGSSGRSWWHARRGSRTAR